MAMTAAVKDELSRVSVNKPSARRAEVATVLRFAGALHLVGGHIVIEAELDTGAAAPAARRERRGVGHVSRGPAPGGGGAGQGNPFSGRGTKGGGGPGPPVRAGRPA